MRCADPDIPGGSKPLLDVLVVDRIRGLLSAEDYRPPQLPATAVQLIELSRKENMQPGPMVALLEQDPLLAADLLRLAQSPVYGSCEMRTLDEAIVRLGLSRTAEVFLHAALDAKVFHASGYQSQMNDLQKHSVAVGRLCRMFGKLLKVRNPALFLCGLLHEVGAAAALVALVDNNPIGSKVPQFAEVWPAVSATHEFAGGLVARMWSFPSQIEETISRHHSFLNDEELDPTSCVVYLADWMANHLGVGFQDEQEEELNPRILERLAVDETLYEKLLIRSRDLLESS